MAWIYNDGGRAASGYTGAARDCVVRAVAIASERPYAAIYAELMAGCRDDGQRDGARTGINTRRHWFRSWMAAQGWIWRPSMSIGAGCRVHLRSDELPAGRIIARVSKHYCAVIDGIINDTHDPSRGGTRCVYGYWVRA